MLSDKQTPTVHSPYNDLRLSPYTDYLCEEYLWMRPIFPDDWFSLRFCFSDPKNMQFFGKGIAWTTQEIQERIHRNAFNNIMSTFPHTTAWIIVTHNGIAGCFWAQPTDRDKHTIELSYCIGSHFSGKGLTTKAGQLVLNTYFQYPRFIGTLFATVHPDNKGSEMVLRKLGLTPNLNRQRVPKFGSIRNYYEKHLLPEKPQPLVFLFSKENSKTYIENNELTPPLSVKHRKLPQSQPH
ncbi:MAG: hypothetical protein RLZ35_421 [Pseudomonadota bacterium]|jgi:RimJ/RimL family protein N-acetyltransferase